MRDQLRTAVAGGLGRRALWVAAFAVAIVGGVALGAVRSSRAPVDQPVFVRGTLTYTWHGDPARGCAAKGLCGAHGSTVVHFDGFGDLSSARRNDVASLDGASAVVRVRRDDPTPGAGACVQLLPVTEFTLNINRIGPGRYSAAIEPTSIPDSRCAGPLAGELAAGHLPARRLAGTRLGFDLRGGEQFADGPFSGTLESTLVLRPDIADETSSLTGDVTTQVFPAPGPSTRRILVEFARLRYRITGAAGGLQTTFSGASQPYCVPYDDCGLAGSLSLSVHGFGTQVTIDASRIVTRRVSARHALADLRAGQLRPFQFPPLATFDATAVETLARAGGGGCQDATRVRAEFIDAALFGQRGLPLSLPLTVAPQIPGGSDPLRTHCPGPTSADVAGGENAFGPPAFAPTLAQGALPLAALGSRTIFVSLSAPGTFSSPAYAGSRSGSLGFSWTLLSAKAGTRTEQVQK